MMEVNDQEEQFLTEEQKQELAKQIQDAQQKFSKENVWKAVADQMKRANILIKDKKKREEA